MAKDSTVFLVIADPYQAVPTAFSSAELAYSFTKEYGGVVRPVTPDAMVDVLTTRVASYVVSYNPDGDVLGAVRAGLPNDAGIDLASRVKDHVDTDGSPVLLQVSVNAADLNGAIAKANVDRATFLGGKNGTTNPQLSLL